MRTLAAVGSPRRDPDAHGRAPAAPLGLLPLELLNRLTPVVACAEGLRRLSLPAEARGLVEVALHAAARTVRTARSLARCNEHLPRSRTSCSLNDLLTGVVREFDPAFRALGITLVATPGVDCQPVVLDLADLRDGFGLLLDVAADACTVPGRGAGAKTEARIEPSPDGLAVVVRFNGEPISEHARRQALGTSESRRPGGGAALALFLARAAARRQGGELRVGTAGGWTRLEITLGLKDGWRQEPIGRVSRLRMVHDDGPGGGGSLDGFHAPTAGLADVVRPVLSMAA